MATALLKTWFAQRDATLRWIEFEAYARRVFANTEALPAAEVEAYEPLTSAARHYGWTTAMALPADHHGAVAAVALDLDLLWWPQRALGEIDDMGAASAKPLAAGQ